MSDATRVLAMLSQRGRDGLNLSHVISDPIDGGKPITRLAARIKDLRDAGYEIGDRRERNGTKTYFLIEDSHNRTAPLTDGGYARDSTGRAPQGECIGGNSAVRSSATEIPGVGHAGEGRESPGLFDGDGYRLPGKPGWADAA